MAGTPHRGREAVGLRHPTLGDGAVVPTIEAVGPWHRCVAAEHDQPWWYSSRPSQRPGRFDLEAPSGTCYLAKTPTGALIERIADPELAVPIRPTVGELDQLQVWSGVLDGPPEVADTTVLSVPGLNEELNSITPYELPWTWADELVACGAQGLVYTARFGRARALGLFGPSSREAADTGQPLPSGGDLVPRPALESAVIDLPEALRPTTVGTHEEFENAPPP